MSAIQKNPFLKYIMKDEKQDVFHSSAYAKAQSGSSLGAASSESYNVRVNIHQNRTRVRGYNESRVMMGAKANGPRAKTYTPPEKKPDGDGAAGLNAGAGRNAAASRKTASQGVDTVKRAAMPRKKPSISAKR